MWMFVAKNYWQGLSDGFQAGHKTQPRDIPKTLPRVKVEECDKENMRWVGGK